MDHDNRDTLMLGQTSQRWDETRIEVRQDWVRLTWHEHVSALELAPRRGLPNSIQVAGRVRHRADPRPVLPTVGNGLDSRVPSNLRAVCSNQGDAQVKTHRRSEILEGHSQ